MMNAKEFLSHLIEKAEEARPYRCDNDEAAQGALDAAHSAFSQQAFFQFTDDLGGTQVVKAKIVQALKDKTL